MCSVYIPYDKTGMARTIYDILQKLCNMLIICYIKNGFVIVFFLISVSYWPFNMV